MIYQDEEEGLEEGEERLGAEEEEIE